MTDAGTNMGTNSHPTNDPTYDPNTGKHKWAKSTSSQYTTPAAAALLAGLTDLHIDLPDKPRKSNTYTADADDWEPLPRVRIFDPACGSGTLLLAQAEQLRIRYGDQIRILVYGCDVNPDAVHAARVKLNYAKCNIEMVDIRLLSYGPQPDGSVRLGALDMITDTTTDESWPWGVPAEATEDTRPATRQETLI